MGPLGCNPNGKDGLLSWQRKSLLYRGIEGRIVPNLLKQNFTASVPYQKTATDITEFHLFGRKVYLSTMQDMYNGEILAYEISEHPVLQQVMTMLEKAAAAIPTLAGCILHSDQGWQYQHRTYQQWLIDHGEFLWHIKIRVILCAEIYLV